MDQKLTLKLDRLAIEQARAEIAITYFEFATLAALWLFSKANLDLVILEVGLLTFFSK